MTPAIDNADHALADTITTETILPFIELDQYLDFVAMCEFVRQYRYMGLLFGPAGAGKTVSSKRYRDEQPLITANGQSPVLYFQLARGEENHKAFYRRVIEAITGVPYRQRMSAADLIAEAKRLLRRYGHDLIIADETGNLNNDGLEGARTLHDETGVPIVFIAMEGFQERAEAQLPQFYSRIAEVLEFGLLTRDLLKSEVLSRISEKSHLLFDPYQPDADNIVDELFRGTGGSFDHGARFREVTQILVRCHKLIQESLDARQQFIAEFPNRRPPRVRAFNAELIREAVRKSKRRGSLHRPRAKSNGTSEKVSLVRDAEGSSSGVSVSQDGPVPR
jgi:AAA domain